MALKQGMTAKALGETIFPYLTTVEGLKLAAQGFEKDVAKPSCVPGRTGTAVCRGTLLAAGRKDGPATSQ
jgi:hypothetical protein